jgi:putative sigma-54 modulation protein
MQLPTIIEQGCLLRWETDGGSISHTPEKSTTFIMKTTESIPIRITPHHLTLSPALIVRVRDKIGPLGRIGRDVVKADVVLRLHHGTASGKSFSASARLAVPGGDIHASATHANLYTAITELEVRLARRLRKRKTRIGNRIEKGRPLGGTTSAARLEETLLSA